MTDNNSARIWSETKKKKKKKKRSTSALRSKSGSRFCEISVIGYESCHIVSTETCKNVVTLKKERERGRAEKQKRVSKYPSK